MDAMIQWKTLKNERKEKVKLVNSNVWLDNKERHNLGHKLIWKIHGFSIILFLISQFNAVWLTYKHNPILYYEKLYIWLSHTWLISEVQTKISSTTVVQTVIKKRTIIKVERVTVDIIAILHIHPLPSQCLLPERLKFPEQLHHHIRCTATTATRVFSFQTHKCDSGTGASHFLVHFKNWIPFNLCIQIQGRWLTRPKAKRKPGENIVTKKIIRPIFQSINAHYHVSLSITLWI